MENIEIAFVFEEIADILELKGEDAFRVRSYRNAARTLRDLTEPLEMVARDQKALRELPGVGKSIAEQIVEILEKGTSSRLVELRQELPANLCELMRVPGLGPKKVRLIYDALGIDNLAALKQAAEQHKIRDLPRMGERTEELILRGIEMLSEHAGRVLIKEADEQAAALGRHLDSLPAIRRWAVAGSLRRRRDTIGDLDLLVEASDREQAACGILRYPGIREIEAQGEEKIALRLRGGLHVDFRFFEGDAFGAALLYFTGSKAHNIAVRKLAQKLDLKVNEYGLFRGEERLAGASEEEVYAAIGLAFCAPELREDRGEVEAAAARRLPRLIELADVQGDLHCHTTETDGRNSLEEMVRAAMSRGRKYLAITDHSKALAMARGLDEERLRRRADEIHALGETLPRDFWLLAGIEVDILKSGKLDLDEGVLAELDWVNASVHSYFDLPEQQMTERLLAAVRSGVVRAIGHPFGRQIGHREPVRFDIDKVFEACREQNVCLEINCFPDRLDLPDVYCKRAKEMGVKIVISTDAHKIADFDLLGYGVDVARRGWLEASDVLNTLPLAAFRARLL